MAGSRFTPLASPFAAARWLRARVRALLIRIRLRPGPDRPPPAPGDADPWVTDDGRPRNRLTPWE